MRKGAMTGFNKSNMTVSLVERELLTIPEHIGASRVFLWGPCYLIFSFLCSAAVLEKETKNLYYVSSILIQFC
jgi:hypothetical protein